jgi:AcrR family transcriptional regulator
VTSSTVSHLTRPGGRSARIRADVHRAVRELLTEGPAEALTVPIIATRAGVHPTTVYRRWGSVGEILADVTASRVAGEVVVPDTGSLVGDLKRWVADVSVDLADPDVIGLMRASIGTGLSEGCSACVLDRRSQLAAILDRAEARGETAPELLDAADHLLGPLYYRAIFLSEGPSQEWAAGLVDQLCR